MATDQQALLLQVSADTSRAIKQLDALQNKIKGVSTNINRNLGAVNDNAFQKLGRGIGNTFRNDLENLAGNAGRAGTALSSLGIAGLAASAAIGGLAVAFAGAREAARFADDISDTANRVHVTTDALQEYRYAVRLAGGDEKEADKALEAFSVTLGKAQQGLAKSQRAFLALGFTKDQIKSFTDADTALKAVSERIAGLSDVQQDAIIQQLGLEGLKPLIAGGVTEMQRLRDEARKVGIVMDADLIKRGAQLNDEFETVTQLIDIQLKSALVDLGPVLLGLLKLMADLASAARRVVDAFKSINDKTVQSLKDARDDRLRQAESPLAKAIPALRNQALKEAATFDAEIKKRAASAKPPPVPKPTRELIDTSSKGGTGGRSKAADKPRDTTFERSAQVEAAVADAERDLLNAWSSLVVSADARAEISNQILDVEKAQLNARLDTQIRDIQTDEGLTAAKKAQLVNNLEIVRTEQDKVDQLKRELVERERVERQAQETLSVREAGIDIEAENLRLAESLAKTASERRDLELQLLDLADQRVRIEQQAIIDSETASKADQEIARRKLEQLDATRGARETVVRNQTQGPLESFFSDLPKTTDQLNERMQALAVNGIQSAIDGLADIATGARSAKDVLRSIVSQMLADVTRLNLQAALGGLFGKGAGGPGDAVGAAITAATGTGGATMGTAITTAGTSAATAMGTAITAAGAQAAAAIGAAMSAGGASSGLKGLTSFASLFSGGSFNFGSNGIVPPDLGSNFFGFGSLGGYANGTDAARGGWAWTGERGPELVNMRPGAKVIPNDILHRLSSGFAAKPASNTTNTRNFSPVLNINISGGGADARRTAMQAGSETMKQLALARKRGF